MTLHAWFVEHNGRQALWRKRVTVRRRDGTGTEQGVAGTYELVLGLQELDLHHHVVVATFVFRCGLLGIDLLRAEESPSASTPVRTVGVLLLHSNLFVNQLTVGAHVESSCCRKSLFSLYTTTLFFRFLSSCYQVLVDASGSMSGTPECSSGLSDWCRVLSCPCVPVLLEISSCPSH